MRSSIETPSRPRVLRALVVTAAAGALLAACGDDAGSGKQESSDTKSHSGTLAAPAKADNAYTYDKKVAPAGAKITADVKSEDSGSTLKLDVTGLKPNRGYAAHAHNKPCGDNGDAAGPHFQHKKDPKADKDNPSDNPKYANPKNEIWLDLKTDGKGKGSSTSDVDFALGEKGPASVVIHKEPKTKTGKGEAGTAGDRVACLTIAH